MPIRMTPIKLFISTTGPIFLLYALTMPTDLTGAFFSTDGAELMTAAYTLGVPHPPGYPTFTILGHLLSQLPLPLGIPIRFHLFSALSLSAACGFIALTVRQVFPDFGVRPAWVCGLLAGTSLLVWQQAIIAEVYALNGLMVSLAVWLLSRRTHEFWIGLVLGLAMTTHLTSVLLLPMAAVFTRPRRWPLIAVGGFIGSLPWLTLPLLATGDSPVVWGDPTTIDGWLWLVTARLYGGNLLAVRGAAFWERIDAWLPILVLQLAGLWLIYPLGMRAFKSEETLNIPFWDQFPWWATAGLYLIYSLGYQPADAIVLLVPPILITAVAIAPLIKKLKNYAILLPLLLIGLNLNGVLAARSTDLRRPTLNLLNNLPNETLVITDGQDQSLFTVWYLHHVEGIRPDLTIVDENLLAFDWYRQHLVQTNSTLSPILKDDLDGLIARERQLRQVCRLSLDPPTVDCLES